MLICPVKEQCPGYYEEVNYTDVDVHRMINELSVHIHIQNDVQIKISLNVCEGVRLPYFFIYIYISFFGQMKWLCISIAENNHCELQQKMICK